MYNANHLVVLLFLLIQVSLAKIPASVQQNYYVTRNSVSIIAPYSNGEPNCSAMYPEPQCDTGEWTIDKVVWNSIELKDVVVTTNGSLVGFFECVTNVICGYRMYDAIDASATFSNPRQYKVFEDSLGTVGSQCHEYPPLRCPDDDQMGALSWNVSEVVKGTLDVDGRPQVGAVRCKTYSLCAYRIYNQKQLHIDGKTHGLKTKNSTEPQQFFSVTNSIPLIGTPGSIPICSADMFPTPVNCKMMHFFLSQKTWTRQTLKGVVEIESRMRDKVGTSELFGLYDCETTSICGYANEPDVEVSRKNQ
eukprot:m.38727 g.38727  ORF g.38727 m.38727 type:complete len:305 (+) comp9466_c0_seq2:44-958(+)